MVDFPWRTVSLQECKPNLGCSGITSSTQSTQRGGNKPQLFEIVVKIQSRQEIL